jgi:hypothetical protein
MLSPQRFKNWVSKWPVSKSIGYRMTLDLQVKIRDYRVLVGPFPSCTPNVVAVTGIFEGSVGNPTRASLPLFKTKGMCLDAD